MKRIFVGVLAVLSVLALGIPTADAGGRAGRVAEAIWIDLGETTGTLSFAAVFQLVDTEDGPQNMAYLGRGPCKVTRHKHGWSARCRARLQRHQLGTDEFEMDPMLDSAHLQTNAFGHRHDVRWTGRYEPMAGGGVGFLDWGGFFIVGAGADAFRDAGARGVLFGDRTGSAFMAFMDEGAGGEVFFGAHQLLLRARIAENGAVKAVRARLV